VVAVCVSGFGRPIRKFCLAFSGVTLTPIGIFGSFAMLKMMGLANDVYAQIGMIMLDGTFG
jgi:HAE1 family hydrophobic/amphiphilic exporter-1